MGSTPTVGLANTLSAMPRWLPDTPRQSRIRIRANCCGGAAAAAAAAHAAAAAAAAISALGAGFRDVGVVEVKSPSWELQALGCLRWRVLDSRNSRALVFDKSSESRTQGLRLWVWHPVAWRHFLQSILEGLGC